MIQPWIERELCTGCGACTNICPQNIIEMKNDSRGFLYPHIVGECVECGKCKTVCNKRTKEKKKNGDPVVYAAWSKDEEIRFLSTSGGIFSELALSVINMGGVISGAQYTETCLVEHGFASDLSGLNNFRQSKYIQSDIKDTYKMIKQYLKNNKMVLFCGTPCQVAALQAYLDQTEKLNLYTIDFICMGVNSPKAYMSWISELEREQGKEIQKIWFKYKENGWKKSPFVTRVCFKDGSWIKISNEENKFMQGFLKNKVLIRPSCGNCQFKGIHRQSDITLGDFWGIEQSLDDDRGTSMVMLNSEKGEKLFRLVTPRIIYHERTIDEVVRGNEHLCKSVMISKDEEQFFNDLDSFSFSEALEKLEKMTYQGDFE